MKVPSSNHWTTKNSLEESVLTFLCAEMHQDAVQASFLSYTRHVSSCRAVITPTLAPHRYKASF